MSKEGGGSSRISRRACPCAGRRERVSEDGADAGRGTLSLGTLEEEVTVMGEHSAIPRLRWESGPLSPETLRQGREAKAVSQVVRAWDLNLEAPVLLSSLI